MNIIKRFLASSPKEELVTIPSGILYLTRGPSSPKGSNECIFKDAVAVIRRTTTDFHYQLVIERVFEEGEEDLEDSDDEYDELEDENKNAWAFLLDEALQLSYFERNGNVVITWLDTSNDDGDRFEFVCDKNTDASVFESFDNIARQSQYERKYQKKFKGTEKDLQEFDFELKPLQQGQEEEEDEPETPTGSLTPTTSNTPDHAAVALAESTPVKKEAEAAPVTPMKQQPAVPAEPEEASEAPGELISKHCASLHLYDAPTGVFVEQLSKSEVALYNLGGFQYWLEVTSPESKKKFLGLLINSDMNPCFNYEHVSFIFNYFESGSAFSWLLKFETVEELEAFQAGFMQALWENTNKKQWVKVSEAAKEYMIESFQAMNIDEPEEEEEEEEEEEQEEERRPQEEDYDIDEEQDEVEQFSGQGKNSQLAVGVKNDRSYVVRGDKIGVFKQAPRNLEFYTTIDKVATPGGKSFAPSKVMLHTEDSNLILQDPNNPNTLYNMDLEYGKIVEEWNTQRDITAFAPTSKFAQMTGEKTLVAAGPNRMFKIDPRVAGDQFVQAGSEKTYASMKSSAIATTEKGHLAVATLSGSIHLYDRLGIRAKTLIPAIGDPIIGVDASADGRWLLATCKNYLLLIDTTIKDGPNTGYTGFQKSFVKTDKPRPKRLQISPEHVAFMQSETGKPLSFTVGHFNTGIDSKEDAIVTSCGPYVITWSLKKIFKGDKEPYLIKRYADNVTADNFKFGSDKDVIVALEDDVGMVSRRTFRRPTRESLATPARRVQPMSRHSIVHTPF